MSPTNLQLIQNELAIVWDDGSESFIPLETLRRSCPCAACGGERDVLGRHHQGSQPTYRPESFVLARFHAVGGYAVNFTWTDGHDSGIYPYPLLHKLGAEK